jgi:hypothetical protein
LRLGYAEHPDASRANEDGTANMQVKPGTTAAALALCLCLVSPGLVSPVVVAPARAAGPAGAEFKTEIEGLLDRLEASTHGLVKWDGADRTDVRQDGDATVADFTNARISIHALEAKPGEAKPGAPVARVTFVHIEIHRVPAPDGAINLAVVFPRHSIWRTTDGHETTLTLDDATAHAIVDAQSNRARETGLTFAGARIDDKATGDWISFGPLTFSSKLVGVADGGWTAPIDFELKSIEFFLTEVPVGGAVERIAYSARSAGPDLAALNRLRDKIEALHQEGDNAPAARVDALIDLLPSLPSLFSLAQGELTVERVVARAPTGEPMVALARASIAGALSGLSGDAAALRITLKHDGLTLAPAIIEAAKVPQRAVLDFGLEDVATTALRSILDAAKTMGEGASEADKQRATLQMIGAAAMLNPVLRIYDFALDTPAVGVEANAQAKGSPLSPKGYSAQGDVAVRGFEALPGLLGDAPLASYLPLLQEIGTTAAASDGTPKLRFRLASAPQKWITVNDNDVGAWFAGDNPGPGQPRALRPAEPALSGADVRAVQKALAAARIAAPQNGAYDGATAVAVARFQKENALNVDGVVDAATRQKLGVKPEPPAQKPEQPRLGGPGNPPSRSN